MVNIDDFIKRLEIILDYYSLSASSFADKIGVQRSSLSHLLSGRNKPSLDLILKIVNEFPEVDLYWIVNGNGNFPKSEFKKEDITEKPLAPLPSLPLDTILDESNNKTQTDLFSSQNSFEEKNLVNEIPKEIFSNTQNLEHTVHDSEIDQIVIFYRDGTFKIYKNQRP
ncbi:MAG TPA: helix-turn-helix transcriptional regulator [Flavobacterium sp.]|nr:helix-turn-helix transcriptional regulator [Flavobacterium sp.]